MVELALVVNIGAGRESNPVLLASFEFYRNPINVKPMPAAAESDLSTSGLMLELASNFLLHGGSGSDSVFGVIPCS